MARRAGATAIGAGAVVAVLTLTVGPPSASAAPVDAGSISGRVVTTTGVPLGGICVGVTNGPGTTTGPDGAYVVDGIEPGDHTVLFVDCTPTPIYVASWYHGHTQQEQADPVTVAAGADVPLADMTLEGGVAVAGRVTDGSGVPLAGINVNVNPFDGPGPSAGAQTAPDGTYRTGPLPGGRYRAQFSDPGNAWATQYWPSAPTFNGATPLVLDLVAGNEHGGVDATLTAAATITGIVTDQTGAPLADVCVNPNTPEQNGFSGVGQSSRTAADGTYSLTGLPGGVDLRVQFHDCAAVPTHVDQWYDGVIDANASTAIVVAAGQARTGVDARLADGIRVGGTVTDPAGNPLSGIDVNVNPDGAGASGYARTDGDGRYITTPVPPGRYRVQFRDDTTPPSWATTYWQQQPSYNSATLLDLGAADAPERDGVDGQLAPAASVSGAVTGPSGQPAGNVCVDAVVDTPSGPDGLGQVVTGADGTYAFNGLPAARLRIRVEDCHIAGPYGTVWWPAAGTYDAAGVVDLAAGEHRTGVDVRLTAAATISGTVTDDQQHPLAGICVQAATTQAFGALAQTDGDGNYQLIVAADGEYTVQFVDCTSQPGHVGRTTPNPVAVMLGQRVTGVDAVLVAGPTSSLSGSVRNAGGAAVTGACAVVYLANQYALFGPVNADGTFTVGGIPSGTYAVAFVGCDTGQPSASVHDPTDPGRTYQAQWWHGVDLSLGGTGEGGPDPIAQHATLVAIGAGQQLTGFDQCFGCGSAPPEPSPAPPTTPPAAPTPPAPPTPNPPVLHLAIAITGHSRTHGSITLTFVATAAPGGGQGLRLAEQSSAGAVFTATCTTATGVTAAVHGPGSPLSVTGADDDATYSCSVSATDGGVPVGASAIVLVDPLRPAELPPTGWGTASTLQLAAVVGLAGALAVVVSRRRSWPDR